MSSDYSYLFKLLIIGDSGQERFRTITATYYRGAHGIIVVYDVNSAVTFLNVKRWFEEIQQHCPSNVSKVIVGNKDDSPDTKVVATQDLNIVAQEFGVPCVETSAKDNVNVDELFVTITKDILKTKASHGSGSAAAPTSGQHQQGGIKIKRVSGAAEGGSGGGKKKCC